MDNRSQDLQLLGTPEGRKTLLGQGVEQKKLLARSRLTTEPEILKALAQDPDKSVRLTLAVLQVSMPDEVWQILAQDQDDSIKRILLRNWQRLPLSAINVFRKDPNEKIKAQGFYAWKQKVEQEYEDQINVAKSVDSSDVWAYLATDAEFDLNFDLREYAIIKLSELAVESKDNEMKAEAIATLTKLAIDGLKH